MKKIFLICAILVLISFKYCENITKQEELYNPENETSSKVRPPLPKADSDLSIYNINPKKDTIIEYNSKATIRVPENAFIDSDGKVVTDDVVLRFRSFSNPLEIFLSGIPMNYKNNGEEKVFESAGMIEIQASSAGKKVYVNPKNKIKVDLLSFDSGNQFSVYNLDTITGTWQEQGKDIVTVKNYSEDLATIPKIPSAPKKAGNLAFSIEDETGKYPELSIYKNVLFEPLNNVPCGFSGTSIEVVDLRNGTYKILFNINTYGIKKEEACICYLAFKEGVDYDSALKIYQTKYSELIKSQKEKRILIEKEWDDYREQLKAYRSLLINEEINALEGSKKIIRTLEVNDFGFINIDYPLDYPQGGSFIPRYVDENNNDLELNNVVLIQKNQNALFRYSKKIKYNPQNDNLLWGLTNSGKLAYFKNEQFKRLDPNKAFQTLKMNVYSEGELTYDKISSVLFEN